MMPSPRNNRLTLSSLRLPRSGPCQQPKPDGVKETGFTLSHESLGQEGAEPGEVSDEGQHDESDDKGLPDGFGQTIHGDGGNAADGEEHSATGGVMSPKTKFKQMTTPM